MMGGWIDRVWVGSKAKMRSVAGQAGVRRAEDLRCTWNISAAPCKNRREKYNFASEPEFGGGPDSTRRAFCAIVMG